MTFSETLFEIVNACDASGVDDPVRAVLDYCSEKDSRITRAEAEWYVARARDSRPRPPVGIIKGRYPSLTGMDWVRRIDKDDLKALMDIVRAAGDYGRLGGAKRANTAKRDKFGRFIKE